jgi:hypothetical protein
MFGKKQPSAADQLRPLLYGDAPLDAFTGIEDFAAVRRALAAGDLNGARARLRGIVADPARGSREHLQAWHELRALGEVPPQPARLYGVVVDMFLGETFETLAAYADGTCRYLHSSGRVLVWEAQDDEVDRAVRAVLGVAENVVARIGPWEGPRPPLRAPNTRLSMLCAGGLYFGEGPTAQLQADPMGGPLLAAAASLLALLTSRAAEGQ